MNRALKLFDSREAAEIFKASIANARVYGEYGCGESTIYAALRSSVRVISVDTSARWASKVEQEIGDRLGAVIWHCDLGPVGSMFGEVTTIQHPDRVPLYHSFPWDQKDKPDLVLIDGRSRVACFAASLMRAAPGTVILFDDYIGRPAYQVVEGLLKPVTTHGRIARFVVPAKIPTAEAQLLYDQFRDKFTYPN